jgi:hypothetical protein
VSAPPSTAPSAGNYNLGVLSRYPITRALRVSGGLLHHGLLHVRVRGVDIFVTHLTPFRYSAHAHTRTRVEDTACGMQHTANAERTSRSTQHRHAHRGTHTQQSHRIANEHSSCARTQHNPVQLSTAQYNSQLRTTQYDSLQLSTAQLSSTQHNSVQPSTIQYNSTQHSTAQHSSVQLSTTQYNLVQLSSTKHRTPQHCTAGAHACAHVQHVRSSSRSAGVVVHCHGTASAGW